MEKEKKKFDDKEGFQSYDHNDIPPDRELITTPYDPPVKSLVEEISRKELIVNPDFQRKGVWDNTRKSRLIESLLLNIPIPVCFFAEDSDGKKVVVDGQQRLRSIAEFVSGSYKLTGLQVLNKLNTYRWIDLTPKQTRIINNRTIRCIVISEKSDPNIRFEVFERLNTGGIPLTDQELRNCVFRGTFNKFLDELAHREEWLSLLGIKKPDNRLAHHELILRFFTVNEYLNSYKPPLKQFLNNFMKTNRHSNENQLNELKMIFLQAIRNVEIVFGVNAFRRVKKNKDGDLVWDTILNRAVFDIQMVGLQQIEERVLRDNASVLVREFENLCVENQSFADSITKATANKSNFYARFKYFKNLLSRADIHSPRLQNLPIEGFDE